MIRADRVADPADGTDAAGGQPRPIEHFAALAKGDRVVPARLRGDVGAQLAANGVCVSVTAFYSRYWVPWFPLHKTGRSPTAAQSPWYHDLASRSAIANPQTVAGRA